MDLINKDIGSEGDIDLKLEGGNLVLVLSYKGKGGLGSVSIGVTPDYFLDKLAKVIPGAIDDAVVAIIKGALKAGK